MGVSTSVAVNAGTATENAGCFQTVTPTIVRLARAGRLRNLPIMRCGWLILLGVLLLAGRMTAAEGRSVYENYCAACHGLDGRGKTPQGRKIKAGNLQESRLTDAEILRRIREGARNKSGVMVMPAFAKELTADDIDAVLLVVKAFRPPAEPAR